MSMKAKVTIGNGWKSVTSFTGGDVLIVKAIETLESNRQRFSWFCTDLSSGKRSRLPTKSTLPIGVSAPGYWSGRKTLVYETVDGIGSLNLTTADESLLVPIDSEKYRILRVLVSPNPKDGIAYVLGHFSDSPEAVRKKMASSGGPYALPMKTYSLHLWNSDSDGPKTVGSFQDLPGSIDIDWTRRSIVALVGAGREKELQRIGLDSGNRSSIRKSDSIAAISISPRGTVLAWGHDSLGIVEIADDSEEVKLTSEGWYPAYSPNKSDFAFTVGDREVWFAQNGVTERVARVSAEMGSNSLDRLVWNSEGNRFAVYLANGAGIDGNRRPMIIADSARHEVLVIEDLEAVGTTGERVWVPRMTMKEYVA